MLLQETLGAGEEIKSRLKSLLPGWDFETLDATGRSGGLEIGWNTHSIKVSNSWGIESGLGITISLRSWMKIFTSSTYMVLVRTRHILGYSFQ
jgi:hypothetical protein